MTDTMTPSREVDGILVRRLRPSDLESVISVDSKLSGRRRDGRRDCRAGDGLRGLRGSRSLENFGSLRRGGRRQPGVDGRRSRLSRSGDCGLVPDSRFGSQIFASGDGGTADFLGGSDRQGCVRAQRLW